MIRPSAAARCRADIAAELGAKPKQHACLLYRVVEGFIGLHNDFAIGIEMVSHASVLLDWPPISRRWHGKMKHIKYHLVIVRLSFTARPSQLSDGRAHQ